MNGVGEERNDRARADKSNQATVFDCLDSLKCPEGEGEGD